MFIIYTPLLFNNAKESAHSYPKVSKRKSQLSFGLIWLGKIHATLLKRLHKIMSCHEIIFSQVSSPPDCYWYPPLPRFHFPTAVELVNKLSSENESFLRVNFASYLEDAVIISIRVQFLKPLFLTVPTLYIHFLTRCIFLKYRSLIKMLSESESRFKSVPPPRTGRTMHFYTSFWLLRFIIHHPC